ncbi:MAG: hypothetical protein O7C75_07205 [Verrucomicrobia bacterium]|nr:hypothetical protein [Verrucomicrobiota bacterium]
MSGPKLSVFVVKDMLGYRHGRAAEYSRISYATSVEEIEKGLDRIERFCSHLV